MVYLEKRNANLALGEKQMASRSFRVFGTRTDLESVFYEFQKLNLVKYYKCGRNENKIDDITKTIYFGISLNGSHIRNQYLVIKDDKSICFDKYKHISQYLNETSVAINLGGLYDENTIVPTTVSTIWYGEDVRGVDYGDLYLIKMPKEGVKGLVTIKRAFNLEMSTGELLQKSKSLPTKLLSNITSSKANIIAEKIGMPGLFEIR